MDPILTPRDGALRPRRLIQARWGLTTAFGVLSLDQDGMFQVAVDHFAALLPDQVRTPGSRREAAG
jgi:hypothetical protein